MAQQQATDTMEKDPVCGMAVQPGKAAARADYEGKTWFFCSRHCQEKFTATPDKYVQHSPVAGARSVLLAEGPGQRPITDAEHENMFGATQFAAR